MKRRIELPANFLHEFANAAPLSQARKDGAIGLEFFPARAAHQLVSRNSKLLSSEVVQGNVDGRNRMDAKPAAPGPECPIVELLPNGGDLKWILPD